MYRPVEWAEFVGQIELKSRLKIHIKSAWERKKRLDHILLVGPAGSGKTSLARLIADELKAPFSSYVMPIKERALKRILIDNKGVVLFDEIHRCSRKEQEALLSVVEDGYLQLGNGSRLNCNPFFTIIAATTEPDRIIKPLYDRFPIKPYFEEYDDEQMAQIVTQMLKKEGLTGEGEFANILGQAAGGIPRRAYEIVVSARDMQFTLNRMPTASEVLANIGISTEGLNKDQLKYLEILQNAGPCGIDLIANHLQIPKGVIMDYERLLMKKKLITYTKGGRDLTALGWQLLSDER